MDLFGKHGRVRTAPMPTWVKVAIDAWPGPAGVVDGYVFRPVNRADQSQGEVLSRKGCLANAPAIRVGCRRPWHRAS